MSMEAVDSGSAATRRRSHALVNVVFGTLLTALSAGCVTGTSTASKFSLFSKTDDQVDAGTASMEPVPVCPNCSFPVGVVADPGQISGHASPQADGVAHQNAQGTSQAGSALQVVPAVPPPVQVPPEAAHGVAGNMISSGSGSTIRAVTQGMPQTAVQQPGISQVPVMTQTHGLPMQTPPMPTTQQMYVQPELPVQQQAVDSQTNSAPPVQNNPGGQKTWEQLQLERQRTQQFYGAHSQQLPQQQYVAQQMVPWQTPGCPPGMQTNTGFDGPWHIHPSQQIAMDGSSCPPTAITSELQSCKDQVDLLRSTVEDLKQSNEKAMETTLILAEQQRRTAEENKMLKEVQKAESQRQLEYFDALLNAITEEEVDQSSVQPDPQASTRKLRSGRSGSQATARPVSRTQTRTQPVTLPAVDE